MPERKISLVGPVTVTTSENPFLAKSLYLLYCSRLNSCADAPTAAPRSAANKMPFMDCLRNGEGNYYRSGVGRAGIPFAAADRLARCRGERPVLPAKLFQPLVLHLLQVQQRVVRALGRANELIELHLDGFGIPVLRVLDQEHHEKRDDRRTGVDDQLPGV